MMKKCLYVQKCVNTVVAILADCSLPQNHQLIKDLVSLLLLAPSVVSICVFRLLVLIPS